MSDLRFSIIPGWIVTDPRLKGRDLQVLCLLGRHIDKAGWCFRSQVKMAKQLACARSTIQASLDRLMKIGVVERRAGDSFDGRDVSYHYRVVFDRVVAATTFAGWEISDQENPPDDEPETGCRSAGTPADISAPPAGPGSAPPAGPGSAPYKNDPDLTTPAELKERDARECEREDGQSGEAAPDDQADRPGTAAFEKRVMRFCSGAGYEAGPWPNWDKGAAPKWIFAQFAKLSLDERAEAERWRDPYLADLKRRNVPASQVIGAGSFFQGKTWTGLDPAILERAEKTRQQPKGPLKPEGWEPCLGPVGMARFFALLLEGQQEGEPEPGAMWLEAHLRRDWPAVHQWKQLQNLKGGVVFGEQWHTLKGAMEPVPRESEALSAWRSEFAARGWPWLAIFDRIDAVFCPKGGPAGLEAFEAALRQDQVSEEKTDDGGEREAAE